MINMHRSHVTTESEKQLPKELKGAAIHRRDVEEDRYQQCRVDNK